MENVAHCSVSLFTTYPEYSINNLLLDVENISMIISLLLSRLNITPIESGPIHISITLPKWYFQQIRDWNVSHDDI